MITSLKVVGGYASKLPALQDKFEFQHGLNILFGPNGCGKSTVIRILGAYSMVPCGILDKGGWSSTRHAPLYFGNLRESVNFPDCLCKPIKNCKAEVDWDGSPSFLNNTSISDTPIRSLDDNSDGLFTNEQLLLNHCSSGEMRFARLCKMIKILKNPPNLLKIPDNNNYNSVWIDSFMRQINYVKSLPRNGKITLLLDEPDRSLAIPNQIDLWNTLSKIAEKIQVILSSHSIFALKYKDNMFDMKEGYIDKCLKILEM